MGRHQRNPIDLIESDSWHKHVVAFIYLMTQLSDDFLLCPVFTLCFKTA